MNKKKKKKKFGNRWSNVVSESNVLVYSVKSIITARRFYYNALYLVRVTINRTSEIRRSEDIIIIIIITKIKSERSSLLGNVGKIWAQRR